MKPTTGEDHAAFSYAALAEIQRQRTKTEALAEVEAHFLVPRSQIHIGKTIRAGSERFVVSVGVALCCSRRSMAQQFSDFVQRFTIRD